MGNISSVRVYFEYVTDTLCCRVLETECDVENQGNFIFLSHNYLQACNKNNEISQQQNTSRKLYTAKAVFTFHRQRQPVPHH